MSDAIVLDNKFVISWWDKYISIPQEVFDYEIGQKVTKIIYYIQIMVVLYQNGTTILYNNKTKEIRPFGTKFVNVDVLIDKYGINKYLPEFLIATDNKQKKYLCKITKEEINIHKISKKNHLVPLQEKSYKLDTEGFILNKDGEKVSDIKFCQLSHDNVTGVTMAFSSTNKIYQIIYPGIREIFFDGYDDTGPNGHSYIDNKGIFNNECCCNNCCQLFSNWKKDNSLVGNKVLKKVQCCHWRHFVEK